jgi:L-cysteine:1D-myo-inositol 2-amino-2-deoxy-alpha-D-glucopyranoside ligase
MAGGSSELVLSGRRLPMVGTARLYVCGITPYDVTHLGHAATFIWADVAAAVLRLAGLSVTTCRNVTDVDDVLTTAADAHGHAYDEFALYQEYLFGKDMAALRVHQPAREPRARHYVVPVQQLATALLATGAAYERDGYVYFRGAATVAGSGVSPARARELLAEYGDSTELPGRADPFDVPVWRLSLAGEPGWPSPWCSTRCTRRRPDRTPDRRRGRTWSRPCWTTSMCRGRSRWLARRAARRLGTCCGSWP